MAGPQVVIGTLGFTAESVMPTLKEDNLTKVYLVFNRHENTEKAFAAAKEYLGGRKIPVERVNIPDPYDIVDCCIRMRQTIQKARKESGNLVVNITGGTKVLAAAGALACIIERAQVVYCHEETKEKINLPLIGFVPDRVLPMKQERFMLAVADLGAEASPGNLAKKLKVTPATVSNYLKTLKKRRLVEVTSAPDNDREKRVKVTDVGRIILGK